MLKTSEREKLQDCLLLVQSAQSILQDLSGKWDWLSELHECFNSADQKISTLLRA